jgi:long-chain acyl-CoA synthetase
VQPSERDALIAALTAPGAPFEILAAEIRGVPMRVYAHAPASMRDVFVATRDFGPRDFLVYEHERLSYADAHALVARKVALLTRLGVRHGDRVAIGMRNFPEWVTAFWAVQCAGAVAVTLNAWWTGDELAYAFEDSGARVAFLDDERAARLAPFRRALPLEHVLLVRAGAPRPGTTLLDEALAGIAPADLDAVPIDPEDHSTIMYTSGTTGRSKGALATHRNHVTNLMNSRLGAALAALQVAADVAAAPAPDASPPQATALQTFPFFHIGGLSGLYVMTAFGGKLALMYRWDAGEALTLIEREGVRSLSGVPTVVRQLLERARAEGRSLDTLAGIASGGAPVPPDLIQGIGAQFERRVAPGNGYGLTETTSAVISNGGEDYFRRPDSVGRPAPVADARIVKDDGSEAHDGEIGEIWIRGPNVVAGYWNKPEATEESFGGGWFRTSDLGYRSEEGFYYVVDRKKDVVIRGGENVYCAEVEAVLHEHDSVLDVAVIGLPDRMLGEEVGAVVQLRAGHTPDAAVLQALVASRLARFKVPTRFFFVDEPLPRTATGKVLKRELKERFASA